MARAKQPARGTTKEEASIRADDVAPVPDDQSAPIETEVDARAEADEAPIATGQPAAVAIENEEARAEADEAPIATEQPAAVGTEDEARAEVEALVTFEKADAPAQSENQVQYSRGRGEEELPSIARTADIHVAGFSTIVAEVTDYSKCSVNNASIFVIKLLGSKSLESAIRLQSEYANVQYTEFVAHMTKIGEIYSKLAKDAFERRSYLA